MADMRFIDELISKYQQQNISEAETIELNKWITESQENKVLFEKLIDSLYISDELDKFYQYDESKGWNKVKASYSFANETETIAIKGKLFSLKNWKKIAAVAASILLIVSAGIFFYNSNKTHEQGPVANVKENVHPADVKAPQTNRATINLANGQLIYLDSTNNGKLAQQGNVNVKKLGDGQIVYDALSFDKARDKLTKGDMQYNTLTNPKGSKVIDMMLSDGSRVWLNAGSSITFPVAFLGNERKVSMDGEIYFEVAHNPKMPFFVSKDKTQIRVLGTHFNVNSYEDEGDLKVTLLEGAVKLTRDDKTQQLAPGQQAAVLQEGSIVMKNEVDIEQVMAWKNGVFIMNNATVESIMRQIARWYDVDIEYNGHNPNSRISGDIDRNMPLSSVLKIMELSGVNCKIDGRKVTVQE